MDLAYIHLNIDVPVFLHEMEAETDLNRVRNSENLKNVQSRSVIKHQHFILRFFVVILDILKN